jgi:glucose-1-phosphate thymidylyltransferase
MRGIVLAGGTGSRLGNLTKLVNKHLFPVGGEPMIHWPLKVLRDNGIDDITIVSTPSGVGQLAMLLGGEYTYRVQDQPGGIAQALACADDKSGRSVAVILGDNVFWPSPKIWKTCVDLPSSFAHCVLHKSPYHDLTQFGVPRFVSNVVAEVVEKPLAPPSDYVVTGLYLFSYDVFEVMKTVGTGKRGEYEMTDVLNRYAADVDKTLRSTKLEYGFWGDAGTYEGILECSKAVSKR